MKDYSVHLLAFVQEVNGVGSNRRIYLRVPAFDEAGALQFVQDALQGLINTRAKEQYKNPRDTLPVEDVRVVDGKCLIYTSMAPGEEVFSGDVARVCFGQPRSTSDEGSFSKPVQSWRILGIQGQSSLNSRILVLEGAAASMIRKGDALRIGRDAAR